MKPQDLACPSSCDELFSQTHLQSATSPTLNPLRIFYSPKIPSREPEIRVLKPVPIGDGYLLCTFAVSCSPLMQARIRRGRVLSGESSKRMGESVVRLVLGLGMFGCVFRVMRAVPRNVPGWRCLLYSFPSGVQTVLELSRGCTMRDGQSRMVMYL
jgi:hypothetical protein